MRKDNTLPACGTRVVDCICHCVSSCRPSFRLLLAACAIVKQHRHTSKNFILIIKNGFGLRVRRGAHKACCAHKTGVVGQRCHNDGGALGRQRTDVCMQTAHHGRHKERMGGSNGAAKQNHIGVGEVYTPGQGHGQMLAKGFPSIERMAFALLCTQVNF